jgi:hypothetical protein
MVSPFTIEAFPHFQSQEHFAFMCKISPNVKPFYCALDGFPLNKPRAKDRLSSLTPPASVSGLTQAQLDTACVDEQTKLPTGLSRPAPCAAAKTKR